MHLLPVLRRFQYIDKSYVDAAQALSILNKVSETSQSLPAGILAEDSLVGGSPGEDNFVQGVEPGRVGALAGRPGQEAGLLAAEVPARIICLRLDSCRYIVVASLYIYSVWQLGVLS